jgi:hypothetical protein
VKKRKLDEALRAVSKVCSDPRIDSDRRDQLLKARRELESVARSGKLDGTRIFLAVELVAAALLGIVEDDVTRR